MDLDLKQELIRIALVLVSTGALLLIPLKINMTRSRMRKELGLTD